MEDRFSIPLFSFKISGVSYYEFVSVWNIGAPVEDVWGVINAIETWPEWWRGVLRVTELKAGDGEGVGAVYRSAWKSALPYTLEFDSEIVRIERLRSIEARAFGELEGRGMWQFESMAGFETRVRYDWRVSAAKRWMAYLSPIARPIFRWNHDVIMNWGEKGLKKRLAAR
jgi:uncharacterized membrane protein